MSAPTLPKLEQHIYNAINPYRGDLQEQTILATASNITFLVKCSGGPNVEASGVSFTFVNVYDQDNSVGHRATVWLHTGPKDFKVVAGTTAVWRDTIMYDLNREVEKLVDNALEARYVVLP
ncbi:hypothetical protein BDW02DRAFT_549845 [Decorospora gaudefroyi]|uniref:Uncharacterized protein n=1 Tax=Decorospora gaudefroyi TaxID=184978 RepID=A0A6A5KGE8_9PLEO|nr:hypothetical protein BDW02DRAFT_549845 [Decorospora gaudefroyi]